MDNLLYRIMLGYYTTNILGHTYKVCNPTVSSKLLSCQIYDDALYSAKYNGWLTDRDIKAILVSNEFVTADIDKNFPEIERRIEDLKISLYEAALKPEEKAKVKKQLDAVKAKYDKLYNYRHMYDGMTAEGYAAGLKSQYLILAGTYDERGKCLADISEDIDYIFLDSLIRDFNVKRISQADFKVVARMEAWRSYWAIGKNRVFGKPTLELSEEQKYLILTTRMYDSAYEHPECPTDDIFEDDDMFDGWMLLQKRKREHSRKESVGDDMLKGRHENAHEVYIPVSSAEAAKKIDDLNSLESKISKRQRESFLAQQKVGSKVTQSSLPDKKFEIQQEAQRQFREKLKGSK